MWSEKAAGGRFSLKMNSRQGLVGGRGNGAENGFERYEVY